MLEVEHEKVDKEQVDKEKVKDDRLYRVGWWLDGECERRCLPGGGSGFYITRSEAPLLQARLRDFCIKQMSNYVCDGCRTCRYGEGRMEWCGRRFRAEPDVVDGELEDWFRMMGELNEWNYLRVSCNVYEEVESSDFGVVQRTVAAETPMKDVVIRSIIHFPEP